MSAHTYDAVTAALENASGVMNKAAEVVGAFELCVEADAVFTCAIKLHDLLFEYRRKTLLPIAAFALNHEVEESVIARMLDATKAAMDDLDEKIVMADGGRTFHKRMYRTVRSGSLSYVDDSSDVLTEVEHHNLMKHDVVQGWHLTKLGRLTMDTVTMMEYWNHKVRIFAEGPLKQALAETQEEEEA